jgi:RND family efflux transporter MFP subunit
MQMFKSNKHGIVRIFGLWLVGALFAIPAHAQFGGPSRVVVSNVHEGLLTPRQGFAGTVFFKEVSDVATEISGKVTAVKFEEGQRVKEGQLLVSMDSALLADALRASEADVKRFETALKESNVRFERAKALLDGGVAAQDQFDEARFAVESNAHQIESSQAAVDRIQTSLRKHSIYAPFAGVVIERDTELGEWKSDGATVAVIAREGVFDIIANVNEEYLPWMRPGDTIPIELVAGNQKIEGKLVTVIPRGDIVSRTFPVKIRVTGDILLFEGMSAIVEMPTGEDTRCVLVPRDAVLNQANRDYLFTIEEGKAVQHWVTVLGYAGMLAGVSLDEVGTEDPVITKGHERLRNGSKVEIISTDTLEVQTEDSDD